MKVVCPHCGKSMDISLEELSARDMKVVCPQCLDLFVVEGVEPIKNPAAPAVSHPAEHTVVCPSCGNTLHSTDNMTYCHYCGALLSGEAVHTAPAGQLVKEQPAMMDTPNAPQSQRSNEAINRWEVPANLSQHRHASLGGNSRSRKLASGGSRATHYVAYIIIVVLLAFFAYIIYLAG